MKAQTTLRSRLGTRNGTPRARGRRTTHLAVLALHRRRLPVVEVAGNRYVTGGRIADGQPDDDGALLRSRYRHRRSRDAAEPLRQADAPRAPARIPVERIRRLLANTAPHARAEAEVHATAHAPHSFVEIRWPATSPSRPIRLRANLLYVTCGADERVCPFARVHPPRIALHAKRGAVPTTNASFEYVATFANSCKGQRLSTPSTATFEKSGVHRSPPGANGIASSVPPVPSDRRPDRGTKTRERPHPLRQSPGRRAVAEEHHTTTRTHRAPERAFVASGHGAGAIDPGARGACHTGGCR